MPSTKGTASQDERRADQLKHLQDLRIDPTAEASPHQVVDLDVGASSAVSAGGRQPVVQVGRLHDAGENVDAVAGKGPDIAIPQR